MSQIDLFKELLILSILKTAHFSKNLTKRVVGLFGIRERCPASCHHPLHFPLLSPLLTPALCYATTTTNWTTFSLHE